MDTSTLTMASIFSLTYRSSFGGIAALLSQFVRAPVDRWNAIRLLVGEECEPAFSGGHAVSRDREQG
jgi:hypothetical protein